VAPENILLTARRIYTGVWGEQLASAVAVRAGVVSWVGSTSEVGVLDGSWERLDLGESVGFPGFVDSHIHLSSYGMRLEEVDLEGCPSLDAALELVERAVACRRKGQWITGGGWNPNEWGGFPHKSPLDRVAPDNPVALESKDGHALWCNSVALRAAGIDEGTPEPPGGVIQRDAAGHLTGVLFEGALEKVRAAMGSADVRRVAEALERAQSQLLSLGLTGVHNCEGPEALHALQLMRERGLLRLRVHMMVPERNLDAAVRLGLRSGLGDDQLWIGQLKVFADGALGSGTAYMLHPYEGTDERGIAIHSSEELDDIVRRANAAGLGVAMHAIGDAANRLALRAFEAARDLRGPRNRIEHAQLLTPEDIAKFAELDVIASMQPIHAPSDRYMADRKWGERCRYAYAWRSLLDSGATLSFGSDAPVESPDPIIGLYSAVERKRWDEPDSRPWYPQERLSMREAVEAYTLGAARAAGKESILGTLEVGKLADLTFFSRDLLECSAEELKEVRVTHTVIGGSLVFQA